MKEGQKEGRKERANDVQMNETEGIEEKNIKI